MFRKLFLQKNKNKKNPIEESGEGRHLLLPPIPPPKDSPTSSNREVLPPAYQEIIRPIHFSRLSIKASDVPQWLWSNAQCRAWLTAVGVTYLNLPVDEAEARAATFEGFGPRLFSTTKQGWEELLGSHRGSSVFCLIFSVCHEKGALPKNVSFGHFKREPRKSVQQN